MRWFRLTVEGAGFSKIGPGTTLASILLIAVAAGVLATDVFHVMALGAFTAIGLFALELEALGVLAKTRRRELAKLWPEVVDSIHSAVTSGMSLMDAIDELSQRGPLRLQTHFANVSARLDSGWTFETALEELKSHLGEVHADRLCELLLLVSNAGSESLSQTLRKQSINLRRDIAQSALIESKQGWVSGTAKIAVAAPWIVVGLLSTRQENAAIYNSSAGALILLVGFIVCVFAYRLVNFLGALPEQPRVFKS